MTVDSYVGLMHIVGLVLLVGTAILLAQRAHSAWGRGAVGALVIAGAALLFANCKPHLKPEWHWSSETHEDDASFAWHCDFLHGYQTHDRKSYEGSAVAVRRV